MVPPHVPPTQVTDICQHGVPPVTQLHTIPIGLHKDIMLHLLLLNVGIHGQYAHVQTFRVYCFNDSVPTRYGKQFLALTMPYRKLVRHRRQQTLNFILSCVDDPVPMCHSQVRGRHKRIFRLCTAAL